MLPRKSGEFDRLVRLIYKHIFYRVLIYSFCAEKYQFLMFLLVFYALSFLQYDCIIFLIFNRLSERKRDSVLQLNKVKVEVNESYESIAARCNSAETLPQYFKI